MTDLQIKEKIRIYELELKRRLLPDKPCPRPDLDGKLIAREFQLENDAIKTYFGRAKWNPKAGSFLVTYEDGEEAVMTVAEVEEYRLTSSKCDTLIKNSGGRCHTFCHLIKILVGHSSLDGRVNFYDSGTTTIRQIWSLRPLGLLPLDDDETHIGPHMWPRLGTYENEKVENAKKIVRIVFCN
jgi:hypothetical protein